MREILFRGKVKYNGNHYFSGEWVKGFYLENEKGESFILDTEEDQFGNARFKKVQVIPETVGQYTGNDDGNTPIFEGDKVTTSLGEMVVKLDSVGWSPFYETDQDGEIYFEGPYKVIGTIHDKGGE